MEALSWERTILSLTVLGVSAYLLTTASSDHFTAIVALVGPLLGAVVTWWFRINGKAQGVT